MRSTQITQNNFLSVSSLSKSFREGDQTREVLKGCSLTIQKGEFVAIIGKSGTGANTSYMIIDKGAQIMAQGTAAEPIAEGGFALLRGEYRLIGQPLRFDRRSLICHQRKILKKPGIFIDDCQHIFNVMGY